MSISDLVLIFRADQKIYIKGSLFNSRRKEGGTAPVLAHVIKIFIKIESIQI